jgi:ribonuclease HII
MGKRNEPKKLVSDVELTLYEKGYHALCGVDEVGRGPLAGPVVAAAVIIPAGITIDGIDDSKKLSQTEREELFDEIINSELICAVGIIDNECIDRINILQAALMAMRKAVTDLKSTPEVVLIDGNQTIPKLGLPQYAVVGGDGICQSIGAASIIAKVTRDRIMDKYNELFPSFTFAQHKGYPTPQHVEELRRHGPCLIHRKSFKPVSDLIKEYALF